MKPSSSIFLAPDLTSSSTLSILTAMDTFFTIASPVPVEAPVDTPVDQDGYGTGGNNGSCTIAW